MDTISELIQTVSAERDARLVEMTAFNNEQEVRKVLGPAKFVELCKAVEAECDRLNASGQRIRIEKPPYRLKVTNDANGRVLHLSYQELGPCIAYQVGADSERIMFRVDKTPAPSLMLMYLGGPVLPMDLAQELTIKLFR